MLPSDEELATLQQFPQYEGDRYEFKGSFVSFDRKIIPTFCAFLNKAEGGQLIIGVRDLDRFIHGTKASSKEMDRFILGVDNILHMKLIITTDGEPLEPDNLRARIVPREGLQDPLVIVECKPKPGKEQMMRDGTKQIRLSASIQPISQDRFYRETEQQHAVHQAQWKIHDQYKNVLAGMQKEMEGLKEKVVSLERENKSVLDSLQQFILARKHGVEVAGGGGSWGGGEGQANLCTKVVSWAWEVLKAV